MYNELLLEGGRVFYEEKYDGGGTTFGINSLKHTNVKNQIKKGTILEMCSGPGFMGFYLNFKGYTDELYLSDINDDVKSGIEKTIEYNNLTNTKFINSNGFTNISKDLKFDTIIINPPHFSSPRIGGYDSLENELMSLDNNMEFHKKFIDEAKYYLKQNGIILLIGNMGGISPTDIETLGILDYTFELLACERFGWIRDSKFYVLKIKKRDAY